MDSSTPKAPIKKKALIIIGITVLVLFFLAEIINSNYEVVPRNKERAQPIINAIYAYEQKSGRFPTTLEALRPAYLNEIPATIWGSAFFYFTNSVDGFGIMFSVDSHYGCGYTDQYKNWECSFGD